MQDTTGIESTYPTTHCVMVGTVTAFITEGPHNDTGVVFVAVNEADGSVQKGVGITFVSADLMDMIVGLHVGFVDEVDAVFVAQIIPHWVVGIMCGTNGVNVEFFHEKDVVEIRLIIDRFAQAFVVVVSVDASHEHGLAVDEQFAVFDFYTPKPNPASGVFDSFAFGVVQGDNKTI